MLLTKKSSGSQFQAFPPTLQVKIYIDNNLNPAKIKVMSLTKDNFTQSLSIKEVLSILKNEDLELPLTHLTLMTHICVNISQTLKINVHKP